MVAVQYREVVQVMRLDLVKNARCDGVARRIKERLGDLVPLAIHLGLLIHVHAHDVLVDAQQVDDGVVLVYEDVWAARDLCTMVASSAYTYTHTHTYTRTYTYTCTHTYAYSYMHIHTYTHLQHVLGLEVASVELAKGAPPIHGLRMAVSCLIQNKGRVDSSIRDGGEGVPIPRIHDLVAGQAADGHAQRNSKGVVALKQGSLGDGDVAQSVDGRCQVRIQQHAAAAPVASAAARRRRRRRRHVGACVMHRPIHAEAEAIVQAEHAGLLALHRLPACSVWAHDAEGIHGTLCVFMLCVCVFLRVPLDDDVDDDGQHCTYGGLGGEGNALDH